MRVIFGRLKQEVEEFGLSMKAYETMQKTSHGRMYTAVGEIPIEQTEGKWVWDPLSRGKIAWLGIYVCLMGYTSLIAPFNVAFLDDENVAPWIQINLIVDVLFICDILVTFNSAFYDSSQLLIFSRRAITLHYIRSWFFLDLVACFPFYLLPDFPSLGRYKNLLRLYRLPRMLRLLRLSRLFKLVQKNRGNWLIDMMDVRTSTFRLLSFVLTTVLAVHIFACFWFFITLLEENNPGTWVILYGLQDFSNTEIYLVSLHWTVETLSSSGFGDIVPCTSLERCVAMLWMSFAIIFIAYTVGCLAAVLDPMNSKENQLIRRQAIIDEFAGEAGLGPDLKRQLKDAVRNNIQSSDSLQSEVVSIFNKNLPAELRFEVALKMHHGSLSEIPFFKTREKAFAIAVFPFLRSRFYPETFTVYAVKQTPEHIFFIISGRCVVLTQEEYIIKRLWTGSYFGDIEMIQMRPRKHTVRTATDCELLSMNKTLLSVIKKKYASVYRDMEQVATAKEQAWEQATSNILDLRKRYKMERKKSLVEELANIREKRRGSAKSTVEDEKNERLKRQLEAVDTRMKKAERAVQETLALFASIGEMMERRGYIVKAEDTQDNESESNSVTDLESAKWSEYDIYSGYATPLIASSR